jgi:transcriptional regulator with GAF, ATPase, and Fis domain
MPPSLHAKLLRFLESRSLRRVGGLKEIKVDVRVIAATHRRLPDLVATGQFRGDLYDRLNVNPIEIPPLRERPEDIPDLLSHFSRHCSRELRKSSRPSTRPPWRDSRAIRGLETPANCATASSAPSGWRTGRR